MIDYIFFLVANMRVSLPYILVYSLGISSAAAETKAPLKHLASETCPWNPTIRKLRPPACASPDFIRRLVLPPSSSSSSWNGPEYCVNGTCVFSHAAQNGGIALITSPHYAEIIQDYADEIDGGAYPPPFYAEEIEKKGIGLRASRPIVKGEVLMARAPTLVTQVEAFAELEVGARDMSE